MIARDSVTTLLARMAGFAVSLGVNITLARVLMAEGVGVWAVLVAFVSLLVQLCGPGIAYANVYYVAQKQWSVSQAWLVSWIWALVCGAIAYAIGAIIIVANLPSLSVVHDLSLLYLFLFAVPMVFAGQWGLRILQGMHRVGAMNLVTFLAALIYLILVFLTVYCLQLGLYGAVLSYIGWHFSTALLVALIIAPIIRRERFSLNWNIMHTSMVYGMKMYVGKLSAWANNRLDVLIAPFFLNPAQIGFYAIAVVVTEKMWLIPDAISQALLPRVSSNAHKNAATVALGCRLSLLILLPGGVLLVGVGWWFLPFLFGSEFKGAYMPMVTILPGVMAFGLSRILSASLIGANRPMTLSVITGVSAFSNILLNILLIPRFGAVGCSLASTGSYSLQTGWMMVWFCRYFNIPVGDLITVHLSDWKVLTGQMKNILQQRNADSITLKTN